MLRVEMQHQAQDQDNQEIDPHVQEAVDYATHYSTDNQQAQQPKPSEGQQ